MGDCWKLAGWVLLTAAMPAGAAPADRDARDPVAFHRIDSDHNGYVSRAEARVIVAEERFDAVDENADGLLNDREYATLRSLRPSANDFAR